MQRVSLPGLCHLSKGCCLSLTLKQLGHCPIHGCLPRLPSFGSSIICILSLGAPTDLGFPVLQELLTPVALRLCSSSGCVLLMVCPHCFWKPLAHCALMHASTWILASIPALSHLSLYHVCVKSHLSVSHPPLHGLLQHFCCSYFSV